MQTDAEKIITAIESIAKAIDSPSWSVVLVQLFAGVIGVLIGALVSYFSVAYSESRKNSKERDFLAQTLKNEMSYLVETINGYADIRPDLTYSEVRIFENKYEITPIFVNGIRSLHLLDSKKSEAIVAAYLFLYGIREIDSKNKKNLYSKKDLRDAKEKFLNAIS